MIIIFSVPQASPESEGTESPGRGVAVGDQFLLFLARRSSLHVGSSFHRGVIPVRGGGAGFAGP